MENKAGQEDVCKSFGAALVHFTDVTLNIKPPDRNWTSFSSGCCFRVEDLAFKELKAVVEFHNSKDYMRNFEFFGCL